MPRHPQHAATTGSLSSRVFSALAAKAHAMESRGERVFPLHVGDTYLEPIAEARAEAQLTSEHPGLHRYAPVQGEPSLLAAISDRLEALGRRVPTERIQVMSGATAGLTVVINTLCDPGDEVLLPSPFWPLIRGIIAGRGAVPVQVPMFDRLGGVDIEAELEQRVTSRTVALYVNTPHNPTSRALPADAVDACVRVAARHDLWLITDEAYQDLWFGAEAPRPVWAREDVSDRYVACHTLSKSYGLAGARIGYTHGPEELMRAIKGVQTFATYCAPRPMQLAAVNALRGGGDFLATCRRDYGAAGRLAAAALGIDPPEGGTFLFFDATPYKKRGEADALPFLDRCLERGVLLTPGSSCGEAYGDWVRLCFTSVPIADLADALERIRPVLTS